jgi:hypothetical protein
MMIDAVHPRDPSYDDGNTDEPKPDTNVAQAHPDFSSAVYSAVRLPTGMFGGSGVTVVTVARDFDALKASVAKLASDLQSPDLQRFIKADAKLYAAYVEFNASFLPLLKGALVDSGPAKVFGVALGIYAIVKYVPDAVERMQRANTEAMKSAPAAVAVLGKLGVDLAMMQASAVKLAADTKRLGGV